MNEIKAMQSIGTIVSISKALRKANRKLEREYGITILSTTGIGWGRKHDIPSREIHASGDKGLQKLANALNKEIKAYDLAGGYQVGFKIDGYFIYVYKSSLVDLDDSIFREVETVEYNDRNK